MSGNKAESEGEQLLDHSVSQPTETVHVESSQGESGGAEIQSEQVQVQPALLDRAKTPSEQVQVQPALLGGASRSISSSNVSSNSLFTQKKPHISRQKSYNRSPSHNKLMNKLPASSSTTSIARPNLNRSKSTDGLAKGRQGGGSAFKRNNRSFTKVAGLLPLTKSMSNQSLKSNKSTTSLKGMSSFNIGLKPSARKGKAIINLDDEDGDYEDVDELPHNEHDQQQQQQQQQQVMPVAERFDSQETITTNNSNSTQNIPSLYEQINRIVPDPTPDTLPPSTPTNTTATTMTTTTTLPSRPQLEVLQETTPSAEHFNATAEEERHRRHLTSSTRSSTEDFSQATNLYGGSLLLSQSTGLVRKIDPMSTKAAVAFPDEQKNGDTTSHLELAGGISFKANPIETTASIAKPDTTNLNVSKKNSYQPDQTIFTNLQRTTNQHIQKKPQSQVQVQVQSQLQRQQVPNKNRAEVAPQPTKASQHYLQDGVNNYNEFLHSAPSSSDSQRGVASKNIETRTQQKLWLQRESSLMDVANGDPSRMANFSNLSLNNLMFAHSYNKSHANMGDLQANAHSAQGSRVYSSNLGGTTVMPGTPGASSNVGFNGYSNQGPGTPEASIGANNMNMNGLLLMVQNNHQNSIQSRTEFERLNREYLNVRRHLNPVGECLTRLEKYKSKEIKLEKRSQKKSADGNLNSAGDTFEEYASISIQKRDEITATINKMWQDAILSTLSSASKLGLLPQDNMKSANTKVSSFAKQGLAPSTRPVKLSTNQSHI
ncbi:TCO89 [Candida oxycetoniae]|uniref:TCO89 n=1 Tax=Candida oxycetoniae TaxID=497107 RepID=A0AAI9WZG0_9ASCO|nr:TCO89 [Candida oxycetoniae]KAI3406371.2 TCO89 [Candida oxycetoniae]